MFSLICAWTNGWINNRLCVRPSDSLWRQCNEGHVSFLEIQSLPLSPVIMKSDDICNIFQNICKTFFVSVLIVLMWKMYKNVPAIFKQSKSEWFDSCEWPGNPAEIRSISWNYQPVWPWSLNNYLVNLSHAPRDYVCPFIAIREYKLELSYENPSLFRRYLQITSLQWITMIQSQSGEASHVSKLDSHWLIIITGSGNGVSSIRPKATDWTFRSAYISYQNRWLFVQIQYSNRIFLLKSVSYKYGFDAFIRINDENK